MKRITIFSCIIISLFCLVNFGGCTSETKTSITEYDITCRLENHTLFGEQTVNFVNQTDNVISELKFNLFGNAFRRGAKYSPIASQYLAKAYPFGINYGSMTIEDVKIDNVMADFKVAGVDENVLVVDLEKELFPNETASIEISYQLSLANVISRTGYNSSTINLGNFYPILCAVQDGEFYECAYYDLGDPFFSDCANYNVKITCDKDYVIASSGALKGERQESGQKTCEFSAKNARSFAFVLSKNFQVVNKKVLGKQVNYYYYNDQNPNASIDYAVNAITLFSDKFGEFPFSTFSVVQTPFIQGGMEYPGLVMISDELEDLPYGEVIVHETAHQWWQSAVGNNEIEYSFLDEGLAEYSVVLFYENFSQYGYTRKGLIEASEKTYKNFCSVYDKLYNKVNTVMLRGLKDFSSEYEYVNIAYIKPCIMYDSLRTTIGEQRFFSALKTYYMTYKFKNATPDDLASVFEKIGAGTNGFFESFFSGKVVI